MDATTDTEMQRGTQTHPEMETRRGRETRRETEPQRRLTEAVRSLTEPRIERVAVLDEEGRLTRTHATEHPPLLAQLRESVRPSGENSAGSSVPAGMRNVIDSTALYEYSRMAAAIGDWCRIAQIPATRDPIADLRAWHAAALLDERRAAWHERQLRGFARTIRAHLDPPTRVELEFSCPVCGQREWMDADGGGTWPLRMEYRREDTGTLSEVRVLCRACRCEWDGLDAVVELGEELAEKNPLPTCAAPLPV